MKSFYIAYWDGAIRCTGATLEEAREKAFAWMKTHGYLTRGLYQP